LSCIEQDLLTNQLRNHEAGRLVGDLVLREIGWALRKARHNFLEQQIESLRFLGRDGNDLAKAMQFRVLFDQRQELAFLSPQKVNLLEQEKDWGPRLFNQFEQQRIRSFIPARRVGDQKNQIAPVQGLANLRHHL